MQNPAAWVPRIFSAQRQRGFSLQALKIARVLRAPCLGPSAATPRQAGDLQQGALGDGILGLGVGLDPDLRLDQAVEGLGQPRRRPQPELRQKALLELEEDRRPQRPERGPGIRGARDLMQAQQMAARGPQDGDRIAAFLQGPADRRGPAPRDPRRPAPAPGRPRSRPSCRRRPWRHRPGSAACAPGPT